MSYLFERSDFSELINATGDENCAIIALERSWLA